MTGEFWPCCLGQVKILFFCRFVAETQMCPIGELFGFVQQSCVPPAQWINVCHGVATTTSTPDTTTSSITTTTTTTSTTSTTPTTSTIFPDMTCSEPACVAAHEINIMHPNPDPSLYYVCIFAIDRYVPELRICLNNQLFGFVQQACVNPEEWVNVCGDQTTTTSQPITTTTSQQITTTTSQPVTTTTQTTPPRLCELPLCLTPLDISRLHPSFDPATFYQCVFQDGVYTAVARTCGSGTVFGNMQQACIPPVLWSDPCIDLSSTTSPPQTLPPINSCSTPQCSPDQVGIRWPNNIPRNFFECVASGMNTWVAQEIVCPVGMWFSYNEQECVPISQWVDVCPGGLMDV
jgi:hypothetical protein